MEIKTMTNNSSFSETVSEAVKLVESEFKKTQNEISNTILDTNGILHNGISQLINNNGKMLRPLMSLLTMGAIGGNISKAVILAQSTELIHNATLFHDDVIDEGEIRRKQKTPRVVFGNTISVLCGDFLIIEAMNKILNYNSFELFNSLTDLAKKMIYAEALQFEWRGRSDISHKIGIEIIEGKTASLFEWIMESCCILEKRDDIKENLKQFGKYFGIVFQLIDDLLDFSPKNDKTPLLDIKNETITIPFILLLKKDKTIIEKIDLEHISDDSYKKEMINFLWNKIEYYNIRDEIIKISENYINEAISLIDSINGTSYKEVIIKLLCSQLQRLN